MGATVQVLIKCDAKYCDKADLISVPIECLSLDKLVEFLNYESRGMSGWEIISGHLYCSSFCNTYMEKR
jgi:hypothetical protein